MQRYKKYQKLFKHWHLFCVFDNRILNKSPKETSAKLRQKSLLISVIFCTVESMIREKSSQLSFCDFQLQKRKVKSEFFKQINAMIDWHPLRALTEPCLCKGFSSTGRTCYDCMVLFRMELMRTWYGLSDGKIEEQVNDRLSFSRFAGLGMDESVPDSTTLCHFRNTLVKSGIYDSLLSEINRKLASRHVIVNTGVTVDASVTDSPRRPREQKEYEVVEDRHEDEVSDTANARLMEKPRPGVDTEAHWVKKAGKCRFGYKRHTVVNQDGFVIAEETTAANESDMKHLATPLEKAGLKQGTPVMTDKGYDSSENRKVLSIMKLKSRIMYKSQKNRRLTERERAVNKAVSKVRYAVERTYGSMHRWFRAGISRYVGLAKTHAQHIMEEIAYNLYKTPGIIVSNCIK